MKQKNVEKLMSLMKNYVFHELDIASNSIATLSGQIKRMEFIELQKGDNVQNIRNSIVNIAILIDKMSDWAKSSENYDKHKMYWDTVHALNCGEEEALQRAFEIRLKSLFSNDEEFINQIEQLHEVI